MSLTFYRGNVYQQSVVRREIVEPRKVAEGSAHTATFLEKAQTRSQVCNESGASGLGQHLLLSAIHGAGGAGATTSSSSY